MTPQQLTKLADDLNVAPWEAAAAVALMRTGRADLLAAVMDRRLSVRAALAAALNRLPAPGTRP